MTTTATITTGPHPGLLVSVRSAAEALAAVAGGASVVDVKEPDRGPLGMADPSVWRSVRDVVPATTPVTVALGDLDDWQDRPAPAPHLFAGVTMRKMGFARAGGDWASAWRSLRSAWGEGPPWVAVAYADWREASAPHPEEVIAEAADAGCAGVLIDTYTKLRPAAIDPSWVQAIRDRLGLVVLAGGLDESRIRDLSGLRPTWFAVRGAACEGADRRRAIEVERVASLVQACRGCDAAEALARSSRMASR